MIRLKRPPKPAQLTTELEQALVAEYLATQKAVWHLEWLQTPLLEMTHHKCAYCERGLGEGVNITLDHYVNRSMAGHRVVEWENLLPCCQNCNSSKGTYNVLSQPFFNPVDTHIQTHLEMTAGGMFRGISMAGKAVSTRLKLNHSDQKAPRRFRLIQEITKVLEDCEDHCLSLRKNRTSREQTKLRNKVEALLEMTRPQAEYAATAATILLHDSRLLEAKNCLEDLNEWTPDLEQMLQVATTNALVLRVRPQTS
jgi:hypothetical protein